MGSKGTNTTTGSFTPPKEFMQAYKDSLDMARSAVSQPYQQYQGNLVAGLNPTQRQGIANVNAAQGMALPYIQRGAQYTQQAAQGITPELYQRFYSPYVQDVANTTQANLLESNAQQLSGLKGGAIQAGAFGGDRGGVAASELARQQNLAMGQTMSGIYNQGYGQAMGLAGQQVANLATSGQQLAGLGSMAQGSALQGAQAQMAAGAQQQATQQAQLQAAYEQWMQSQAYPYQQAQFFANIAQGLGAGAGGTSSPTGPSPNLFSQALGGLGAIGSIASDERVKENIQEVGRLNDGQTIYRYNFKGDPKTQIGLLAQEVEHHKPGAVHEVSGLKMVNYNDATNDAARMSSAGGVVAPSMDRMGFADGGVPFYPYGNASSSYVPEGKINVRGSNMPSPPDPASDKGLSEDWDNLHPFTKDQLSGLGKIYAGLGLPSKEEIKSIFAPKDKEVAYVTMSDPDYSAGYGLASGGVAGRKHFADGGTDMADEETDANAGLGAAPAPEPSSGLGIGKIFASAENPSIIERIMGRRLSPEARAAIMDASFALMAGRSPFFMSNVGEAGRVGSQAYSNAVAMSRKAQQEDAANAEKEAQKAYLEDAISSLPPEQQAMARAFPEKFIGAQIESQFGAIDEPALVQEYKAAKEDGFTGTLEDWKKINTADGGDLGLQLVPLIDKNGNFIGYGQASKAGGVYYQGEPIDGTNIRPMDPSLVAQSKAAGTTMGTQMGGAAAEIPGAKIDANALNATIDVLVNNPNLESAIGYGNAVTDYLVSNDVLKIRSELNKLEGGAFLSAYTTLKGGGAITEMESSQAQKAIADMQTARKMSDKKMFIEALESLREAFNRGVAKLQAKAGQYAPPESAPQTAPPTYKYNQETGEVE